MNHSVILAGKRDNCRHFSTRFCENGVVLVFRWSRIYGIEQELSYYYQFKTTASSSSLIKSKMKFLWIFLFLLEFKGLQCKVRVSG